MNVPIILCLLMSPFTSYLCGMYRITNSLSSNLNVNVCCILQSLLTSNWLFLWSNIFINVRLRISFFFFDQCYFSMLTFYDGEVCSILSDVERPKTPNNPWCMDGVLADGGGREMNALQTDARSWTMLSDQGPPSEAYLSPQWSTERLRPSFL